MPKPHFRDQRCGCSLFQNHFVQKYGRENPHFLHQQLQSPAIHEMRLFLTSMHIWEDEYLLNRLLLLQGEMKRIAHLVHQLI